MNRKLLISLGGLAAAVLLFVFVVSPLMMPDDVDTGTAAPTAGAGDAGPSDAGDTDPEESTAEQPDEAAPLDETFEVFTARDPFQQLVAAGGQMTPASSTGDGDGGDGDGGDGDGGDGDGGDGGGQSTSDASVGGTTIGLIEVFDDVDGTPTAQVTVNGSGYDVTEGDEFAGRFRVLDITGQCATLLFGDQRFTLCEGETIRK